MLTFLQREIPAIGSVFYPGPIPPPLEQLSGLGAPIACERSVPSAHEVWVAQATHPTWGKAEIACLRESTPIPSFLLDYSLTLSEDEKRRAQTGQAVLAVRVQAHRKHVLRDRKLLLHWLRALMASDGAIAADAASQMLWSQAMLDDELAHDADLDVESLYSIHAVQAPGEPGRVEWLHTHGLEELRAFDIDVLQPSPVFVDNCGDPIRALAFAALEGEAAPNTGRFHLLRPGGDVRLVPADRFDAEASEEHRRLRDADEHHSGRRAVVCEPVGRLFGRWRSRPEPARFLSQMTEISFVVNFTKAASALMAERAVRTIGVFRGLREEFASLRLPTIVKLGYEVEGGDTSDREHLWFEVHEIRGDTVDATLANAPHHVPSLTLGQRGEFGLDRLTDWAILSPEGPMTPRNVSAARRLRVTRDVWQARRDAAEPSTDATD
jgi:uncharacterized protein YegJ (DUF2314 family)